MTPNIRRRHRERLGELTQCVLTGELRPRTVSKPSRSLQGGCAPPVRHNYWHTACQPRMETLRGASTETLLTDWRTGGSRKRDTPRWDTASTTVMLNAETKKLLHGCSQWVCTKKCRQSCMHITRRDFNAAPHKYSLHTPKTVERSRLCRLFVGLRRTNIMLKFVRDLCPRCFKSMDAMTNYNDGSNLCKTTTCKNKTCTARATKKLLTLILLHQIWIQFPFQSYFEFKKLQDSIKITTQRLRVYWQEINPCFFASIVYNIGFLLDRYHLNQLKVIYSWNWNVCCDNVRMNCHFKRKGFHNHVRSLVGQKSADRKIDCTFVFLRTDAKRPCIVLCFFGAYVNVVVLWKELISA